jgi:hypothetical protein
LGARGVNADYFVDAVLACWWGLFVSSLEINGELFHAHQYRTGARPHDSFCSNQKTILAKSTLPYPNKSNLLLIRELLSSVMRNCKTHIMAKGGRLEVLLQILQPALKAIAQGWAVLE